MSITRRDLLWGTAALAGCRPPLARRYNGYAFIASQGARSVTAVSLSNFKVARQIPLLAEPSSLVVSKPRAYVLTPGNATVSELDAGPLKITRTKHIGAGPIGMRLSDDGSSLWILCREPQALLCLDLKTWDKPLTIRLPAEPVDFDIDRSGERAVIALSNKSMVIAEHATGKLQPAIDLNADATIVRFRPDGKQILAGNRAARTILAIDPVARQVAVTLPLAVQPENFCFSTDNGGQLFVTGQGMDAVVIVSPYQTAVGETILAGKSPGPMAANNNLLFVTNPQSGDLTVISIADRRVMAKILVGEEPAFVLLTGDDQYALVVNRKSDDMAVVRLSKITDARFKRAPLFTVVPIGSRPVSAAICPL